MFIYIQSKPQKNTDVNQGKKVQGQTIVHTVDLGHRSRSPKCQIRDKVETTQFKVKAIKDKDNTLVCKDKATDIQDL